MSRIIANCIGFQWDDGNIDKSWDKHGVANVECEELFFNQPLIVANDSAHSESEERHLALGRTDSDRWLYIAFTIRGELIRVISARDMNEKETRKYAERVKRYSNFRK